MTDEADRKHNNRSKVIVSKRNLVLSLVVAASLSAVLLTFGTLSSSLTAAPSSNSSPSLPLPLPLATSTSSSTGTPGNSGNNPHGGPPGQTGNNPGQSGSTPGQSGSPPPGKSGAAPGQGKGPGSPCQNCSDCGPEEYCDTASHECESGCTDSVICKAAGAQVCVKNPADCQAGQCTSGCFEDADCSFLGTTHGTPRCVNAQQPTKAGQCVIDQCKPETETTDCGTNAICVPDSTGRNICQCTGSGVDFCDGTSAGNTKGCYPACPAGAERNPNTCECFCTAQDQTLCGTPPACLAESNTHCGPTCKQCASNEACKDSVCTAVCPAGQIACFSPSAPGEPPVCGDPSTGITSDSNDDCQCPTGKELFIANSIAQCKDPCPTGITRDSNGECTVCTDTSKEFVKALNQCLPPCPSGTTRDANTGLCSCNDDAQTYCTNYNQCINLNSPESCGTPSVILGGVSCDDVKTCAAPTGGSATCDSGQCGQTCNPIGGIEEEVCNGTCVPKCPSGATRDPTTCTCPCPSDKPDVCGNICVNTHDADPTNCGGCGVDNPSFKCQQGTTCKTDFDPNTGAPNTRCVKVCPAGQMDCNGQCKVGICSTCTDPGCATTGPDANSQCTTKTIHGVLCNNGGNPSQGLCTDGTGCLFDFQCTGHGGKCDTFTHLCSFGSVTCPSGYDLNSPDNPYLNSECIKTVITQAVCPQ
ncbi:MAG: hypothetical protein WA364_12110 [Candidatus Nitrosopolaris sp.]